MNNGQQLQVKELAHQHRIPKPHQSKNRKNMLSKSQKLVYEAIISRLNIVSKELRDHNLTSDELQKVSLWIDGLKLVDTCKIIPGEPRYDSSSYKIECPVIQMITVTPTSKILIPSDESISKAQEIRQMSDERIIELAKQMGIKL